MRKYVSKSKQCRSHGILTICLGKRNWPAAAQDFFEIIFYFLEFPAKSLWPNSVAVCACPDPTTTYLQNCRKAAEQTTTQTWPSVVVGCSSSCLEEESPYLKLTLTHWWHAQQGNTAERDILWWSCCVHDMHTCKADYKLVSTTSQGVVTNGPFLFFLWWGSHFGR